MPHYDLTREPWLPVLMQDRTVQHLGFRDVFANAHNIRDIALPSAPERLAVLSILITLNLRAYPDWDDTWEQGHFDPQGINDDATMEETPLS